jgi:DUF1365 family protein
VRSHLLVGKVRHRRARPVTYGLEHDVFYAALDLGELDEVAARSRLIRRNRRGLVEFRDADHLPTPSADVAADVRALLTAEGDDPAGWRITLITNLRILGYVFNPASFYLCRDAAGVLRRVLVEVHNTFGERHLYPLRPADDGEAFRAGMAKAFFVSPFISVDGAYDGTLLGLLLRYPLMTQRTIALIHWHAFRLWLRGAPFFRHGAWRREATHTARAAR